MYKGFYTRAKKDIYIINESNALQYEYAIKNNIQKTTLEFFINNHKKILDGSSLSECIFPINEYDIFLSHSGSDINLINKLAYQFRQAGITPFVDSHVWGYYDDLLTALDNRFNILERGESYVTYSYQGVKNTASHVHMMLSTSLNKMIDKCEFFLFVETKNSTITLQDQKKTLSPWIMSELETSRIIRKYSKYKHDMITEDAQVKAGMEKDVRIAYTIPTDHLIYIDWDDLLAYLSLNKYTKKLLYETVPK